MVVPTHCPILGIPICVLSKSHDHSATIDRVDNSRGYIRGNVAVISMRANQIKGNGTSEELRKVAQFMESWNEAAEAEARRNKVGK